MANLTGDTTADAALVSTAAAKLSGLGYHVQVVAGSSRTPATIRTDATLFGTPIGSYEQSFAELGAAGRGQRATSAEFVWLTAVTGVGLALLAGLRERELAGRYRRQATILNRQGWTAAAIERYLLVPRVPDFAILLGAGCAAAAWAARANAPMSAGLIAIACAMVIVPLCSLIVTVTRVSRAEKASTRVDRRRKRRQIVGSTSLPLGVVLAMRDLPATLRLAATTLLVTVIPVAGVAVMSRLPQLLGTSEVAVAATGPVVAAQSIMVAVSVATPRLLLITIASSARAAARKRTELFVRLGWQPAEITRIEWQRVAVTVFLAAIDSATVLALAWALDAVPSASGPSMWAVALLGWLVATVIFLHASR